MLDFSKCPLSYTFCTHWALPPPTLFLHFFLWFPHCFSVNSQNHEILSREGMKRSSNSVFFKLESQQALSTSLNKSMAEATLISEARGWRQVRRLLLSWNAGFWDAPSWNLAAMLWEAWATRRGCIWGIPLTVPDESSQPRPHKHRSDGWSLQPPALSITSSCSSLPSPDLRWDSQFRGIHLNFWPTESDSQHKKIVVVLCHEVWGVLLSSNSS